MSISEKDLQEKEKKVRQIYGDKIALVINQQAGFIETAKNSAGELKINADLPNIGITLSNKINEMALQFKRAGISMFVSPSEKYDYIDLSFVGSAIIDDMLQTTRKANGVLDRYAEKVTPLIEGKNNALISIGPVKKFFLRVRAIFNRNKMSEYPKEDVEEAKNYLNAYKDLDSKILNYDLRANAITALVNSIKQDGSRGYNASVVPRLLEENVNSDLEKLGLSDLIPQLQEALIKEYKKDLPEQTINSEDMYLYVPDFNRREGLRTYSIQALEQIVEAAKVIIANSTREEDNLERSLKESGIQLRDFENIDTQVTQNDRQDAIENIRETMTKDRKEKDTEKAKVVVTEENFRN